MAMESNVEKTRNQTVAQAYDALYKQAGIAKTRRETELLGGEQWRTSEPDEFGRVYRTNLTTGKQEQVSGASPTPPLSFEQKRELANIVKTFDWWRNPTTQKIEPVRKDQAPPKGFTERVPSKEVQVSDISERRLGLAVDQAAKRSFQVATKRENKKLPAVKDDIAFVNKHSKGTIGLIWLEEEGFFGGTKAVGTTEVRLPKNNKGVQITLEDVRKVAADNGMAIEELLKQIYDKQQEKK